MILEPRKRLQQDPRGEHITLSALVASPQRDLPLPHLSMATLHFQPNISSHPLPASQPITSFPSSPPLEPSTSTLHIHPSVTPATSISISKHHPSHRPPESISKPLTLLTPSLLVSPSLSKPHRMSPHDLHSSRSSTFQPPSPFFQTSLLASRSRSHHPPPSPIQNSIHLHEPRSQRPRTAEKASHQQEKKKASIPGPQQPRLSNILIGNQGYQ